MKTYSLFICLLTLLFVAVTNVQAQDANIIESLKKYEPGQGKVNIYQEPGIARLVGSEWSSMRLEGQGTTFKTTGYRVQVYAGSNSRESRNQAEAMASRVKTYFPDLKVYTTFLSPRWICRVGDFRSIEEADVVMRQLRNTGVFKEVSIVREQVVISL